MLESAQTLATVSLPRAAMASWFRMHMLVDDTNFTGQPVAYAHWYLHSCLDETRRSFHQRTGVHEKGS